MEMTSDQKSEIIGLSYGLQSKIIVLRDWQEAVIDTVSPETIEELGNVKQLAYECLHRASFEKDFRQGMDLVQEADTYVDAWIHLLQQATIQPGFNSALA